MNTHEMENPSFSPFWPVCLMGISLVVFLAWQMTAAVQQYIALLRLGDHQVVLQNQAQEAETKLKETMVDLILLAKTDPEAKAIVTKHGIKYNPNEADAKPVQTLKPEPKPKAKAKEAAKPAPKPAAKPSAAE